MKITSHIIVAASLVFFMSCSEGESKSTAPVEETSSLPVTNAPAPVAAPGEMPAANPTDNSSVALNPAHGEPGHRCDIAVGALLNSAPQTTPVTTQPQVNTASQPTFTSPVMQPPTAPTQGSATGKVNPAHGEPGHDCTIAVGAPLK